MKDLQAYVKTPTLEHFTPCCLGNKNTPTCNRNPPGANRTTTDHNKLEQTLQWRQAPQALLVAVAAVNRQNRPFLEPLCWGRGVSSQVFLWYT